jgi:mono/diheme cytochrome c family protein
MRSMIAMLGDARKPLDRRDESLRRSIIALLAAATLLGCQQQMAVQPSVRSLRPAPFFRDGRSTLLPVAGTVAQGQLREDDHPYLGKKPALPGPAKAAAVVGAAAAGSGSGNAVLALTGTWALNMEPFATTFPFPIDRTVLERGRREFEVFCAVCHDRLGMGRGVVTQRGFTSPPSYHIPRLRQAPLGYLFDVITNGKGAMPDHASQIEVADRWAIVAYLRVLQRSQDARLDDVPEPARVRLENEGRAP